MCGGATPVTVAAASRHRSDGGRAGETDRSAPASGQLGARRLGNRGGAPGPRYSDWPLPHPPMWSGPAAWAWCTPPTIRSSIARSRSSCCATGRDRERAPRSGCCARRRRMARLAPERRRRATTSARSTTSVFIAMEFVDGRDPAHAGCARAARAWREMLERVPARPGAGWRPRTPPASSTATSSRTTCSSATTAACASSTSGSRAASTPSEADATDDERRRRGRAREPRSPRPARSSARRRTWRRSSSAAAAIDARADQFSFCVALLRGAVRRAPVRGRHAVDSARSPLAGELGGRITRQRRRSTARPRSTCRRGCAACSRADWRRIRTAGSRRWRSSWPSSAATRARAVAASAWPPLPPPRSWSARCSSARAWPSAPTRAPAAAPPGDCRACGTASASARCRPPSAPPARRWPPPPGPVWSARSIAGAATGWRCTPRRARRPTCAASNPPRCSISEWGAWISAAPSCAR